MPEHLAVRDPGPEVLAAGREREPSRRRRRALAGLAVLLVTAGGVAWWSERPGGAAGPDGRVLAVTAGGHDTWVVDLRDGRAAAVPLPQTARSVLASGSRVVVLLAPRAGSSAGDAGAVVSLPLPDGSVRRLGEADQVLPAGPAGVWLLLGARGSAAPTATLAGVSGDGRSHVYLLPRDARVVAAVDDGLVTARASGPWDARFALYDPQLRREIQPLGRLGRVLEGRGPYLLATASCPLDCPSSVVDTRDGSRVPLLLPPRTTVSGPPALSPDGRTVAQVVRTPGSAALAWGSPGALRLVADVVPVPGSRVTFLPDGSAVVAVGPRRLAAVGPEGAPLGEVDLPIVASAVLGGVTPGR